MRLSEPATVGLRNATGMAKRGLWFVSLQAEQPEVLAAADL